MTNKDFLLKKLEKMTEKDFLLKELDTLKTYFEEVIDSANEDDVEPDIMFMLNNLKEYVEDAIKYVKGDK